MQDKFWPAEGSGVSTRLNFIPLTTSPVFKLLAQLNLSYVLFNRSFLPVYFFDVVSLHLVYFVEALSLIREFAAHLSASVASTVVEPRYLTSLNGCCLVRSKCCTRCISPHINVYRRQQHDILQKRHIIQTRRRYKYMPLRV